MIKALVRAEPKDFVFLGLTHRNLNLLREGNPIHINGAELGLAHDIVIHANTTDDTILEEMKTSGLIK